ncbi:MAG: transglycosylase SLT domain-containing protein [Deltaproteobacteria bacterium]|nr:transglycosylase SLT domain-containing protein [Deltaproteobacteria bacterium]
MEKSYFHNLRHRAWVSCLALALLSPVSAMAQTQDLGSGKSLAELDDLLVTVDGILISTATKLQRLLEGEPPKKQPHPQNAYEVFAASQHGPFDDLVLSSARHWKLDPFLFKGLLANESRLDPVRFGKRAYSQDDGPRILISGGAMGIAQFTGGGVRAVNLLRRRRSRRGHHVLTFDRDRAFEPTTAVPAAAELLAHLLDRYGRDGGITAYNSGVVGGATVSRYGFWRARHQGKLSRVGIYLIQGERFLLNVLRYTNWFRRQAGLPPLEGPDAHRPDSLRFAGLRLASNV